MNPLKDFRLISLLNQLEQAIDCDTEEILRKDWENFWENGSDTPFFSPERKKKQQFQVPSVSLNDTLAQDTEGLTLLLMREYAGCLSALAGNGQLLRPGPIMEWGFFPLFSARSFFICRRSISSFPTFVLWDWNGWKSKWEKACLH